MLFPFWLSSFYFKEMCCLVFPFVFLIFHVNYPWGSSFSYFFMCCVHVFPSGFPEFDLSLEFCNRYHRCISNWTPRVTGHGCRALTTPPTHPHTPPVWDSVYGFDMSVIKTMALLEPLVDVVDGKSVVSHTTSILSLDLLTCTKVRTLCAVLRYIVYSVRIVSGWWVWVGVLCEILYPPLTFFI